jgi:hypothetical protein
MVTGGYFPGVRRQGREADHLYLVPTLRIVELHLHFPILLHGVVLINQAQE